MSTNAIVKADSVEKPSVLEVMKEVFKDIGEADDSHWFLLNNGTFYTFKKLEYPSATRESLESVVLDMCAKAALLSYEDNDCVSVYPYKEWKYPVYVVLSVLRAKIGWIIVGATDQWAETDQQLAAVGYLGRTKYELDNEEHKIVASSFD